MDWTKVRWEVQPPITKNSTLDVAGVLAICFQNMGDLKVMVDRHWTVLPTSSTQAGVFQLNGIMAQKILVQFDPADANKRLEVSYIVSLDQPSNYPSNC